MPLLNLMLSSEKGHTRNKYTLFSTFYHHSNKAKRISIATLIATPIKAHLPQDFAFIGVSFLKTKYMINPAKGTNSESQFKPVEGSSASAPKAALLDRVGVTALPQ